MANLYSSKLVSGTWNHTYSGSKYSDRGSWQSNQDKSVKGFWRYNYNNTATVILDENKNGVYEDDIDTVIGTAHVAGASASMRGGTWNRFKGMTVGGFTGSSWGLFQIETPVIFDTSEKADVITGSILSDYINGKGGNDKIAAGNGSDTILGGLGADVMHGGNGADTFVYNTASESGNKPKTRDSIKDFSLGEDKIDLSALNTTRNLRFIGSTAFTGTPGDIRFSSGIVSVDFNGDRKSDFEIALTGVKVFNASGLTL